MSEILTALLGGTARTVTVDGVELAPEALLGAAGDLARRLPTGAPVAVHATPSVETVVAVVGGLLAGVPVVPVPADAGEAERAHVLSDSGATCWAGAAPADPAGLRHLAVDLDAHAGPPTATPSADDVALILYTSGTTGAPKGVLLPHRAISAGLDALAEAWSWTREDTLAHGLPLYHVHGLVLGVLGPLRLGSALVHTGRPTPDRYADAARAGATLFFGVPTVWSRIAASEDDARPLATARLLVSGSAALPAPVFERLRELTGHEVAERYGMSETLITVAARAHGPRLPGVVGVPVRDVATRLVADDGSPVPRDGESVGNLEVRGPTLFAGYLGRLEATAECWTDDGWFCTGDVATIDADGLHRIVGRASVDLIKSGGYRIGAGEVEASLLGHPAVAECAVVGLLDADLGQRVVAFVVLEAGVDAAPALADELIAHVRAELAAHKRPREIRFVASLPRNAMGKVQKRQLT